MPSLVHSDGLAYQISGNGVSFVSSTSSKLIPVLVALDVVGLVTRAPMPSHFALVVVVAESSRGIASVLR